MVVMSSVRSSMSRSAPATPTTDGDVDEHGGLRGRLRGHGATTGAVSESRYPRPKASTYGCESTSGGVSRKSFRPTRAGFFQIWYACSVSVYHLREVGRYVRTPSASVSSEPTAPGHWRKVSSLPPMKTSSQ